MTTWFTSDWHLFHENIIQHCHRPFRSHEAMNRTLVENYCAVVQESDTVYFLGDLTMRGPTQIDGVRKLIMKLPGQKHFIMGNHDRLKVNSYLRMGFLSFHTSLDLRRGGVTYHMAHDPKDALPGTSFLLCGHVHDHWKYRQEPFPTVNVGVDVWDFSPVRYRDVLDWFANPREWGPRSPTDRAAVS